MKFEDLTNEQLEKAKACETYEEKMAFIKEYEIELTDDQMDAISGGHSSGYNLNECSECHKGTMKKTGKTRPGKIFGDLWPDVERKCNVCGNVEWYEW